jgi:hypothetical protein
MFTIEKLNHVFGKWPRKGHCKRSVFAVGWHRVGVVPLYYDPDELKGWHCQEMCLECGKFLKQLWFVPEDVYIEEFSLPQGKNGFWEFMKQENR